MNIFAKIDMWAYILLQLESFRKLRTCRADEEEAVIERLSVQRLQDNYRPLQPLHGRMVRKSFRVEGTEEPLRLEQCGCTTPTLDWCNAFMFAAVVSRVTSHQGNLPGSEDVSYVHVGFANIRHCYIICDWSWFWRRSWSYRLKECNHSVLHSVVFPPSNFPSFHIDSNYTVIPLIRPPFFVTINIIIYN